MSFSFSAAGTIAECRKQVHEYYASHDGYAHDSRSAKAAVHHELDYLEAQGATHAKASANGHAGSWSINVYRDTEAETAHKEAQELKEKIEWKEKGHAKGWLDNTSKSEAMAEKAVTDACAPDPKKSSK